MEKFKVLYEEALKIYPDTGAGEAEGFSASRRSSRRRTASQLVALHETLGPLLYSCKPTLLMDYSEPDSHWPQRLLHLCRGLAPHPEPWLALLIGGDVVLTSAAKLRQLVQGTPCRGMLIDVRHSTPAPCWLEDAYSSKIEALQTLMETVLEAPEAATLNAPLDGLRATLVHQQPVTHDAVWRVELGAEICPVAAVGWLLGYGAIYWARDLGQTADSLGHASRNNLALVPLVRYRATLASWELWRFTVPAPLVHDARWLGHELRWRSSLPPAAVVLVDQLPAQSTVGL